MFRTPPALGDSRDQVIAKFGQPTSVYADPGGELLEYATGPMGQHTWMARLDAGGKLARFDQVLGSEHFGRLRIDHSTKDAVLRTVGRPGERSAVHAHDLEVWSYRYKESGVWNSMMHLHFDNAGVLRQMVNAQDPMFEEKRR